MTISNSLLGFCYLYKKSKTVLKQSPAGGRSTLVSLRGCGAFGYPQGSQPCVLLGGSFRRVLLGVFDRKAALGIKASRCSAASSEMCRGCEVSDVLRVALVVLKGFVRIFMLR